MLNQNQSNFIEIDEPFKPYIKCILEAKSFGVNRRPIVLNNATSSGKTKADRFSLLVPYGDESLQWTVMFNSSCPELGPDFQFHNDSFLSDPNVDTIEKNIPSLANWQPMDPECLLNVLTELTVLYKQHQVDLLSNQEERLLVEYQMIVDQSDIRPEDVEVILKPNDTLPTEAKFFIRLNMNFSRLPGRTNKATDDQAVLTISFQHPNWNRIIPQLFLTLKLEDTFGGSGNLHIPSFQRNACIVDYLAQIKKIIDAKIDEAAKYFEMKNTFIATVLMLQRRNVIEYDAINFTRITILLEHQDFYFLVHIQLPACFPREQPQVTLQSIYHMTPKDEPLKKLVKNYHYDPKWAASFMINKILTRIVENELVPLKNGNLTYSK